MTRINLQDSVFLRLESKERPFHIAGLTLLTLPQNAPANYFRNLSAALRRLPEAFPVFAKKLSNPGMIRNQGWVDADDYDPAYHVFHYALPAPGRLHDLISLITRVHERVLERSRPLWEFHLIEGLEDRRFAIYCKFHHAIVDGVGALQMVNQLFSPSPTGKLDIAAMRQGEEEEHETPTLLKQLGHLSNGLVEQSRAIPELYGMLGTMGRSRWLEREDAPPLPFTAPHALFNQEVTAHRHIAMAELPLKSIKKIGARFGGTINDAIVAICGGALRDYLLEQGELPEKSLFAGIPVAIEPTVQHKGNQLSTIICPFGTNLDDPAKRMERIVHITRQAKNDLKKVTPAASQDYMNLVLIPSLVFTLAGAATRVPPPFNVIVSNVPGPRQRRYLNGATVDALYPLSLVTDAQGLNITAVSYVNKLCLGIIACPSFLPQIDTMAEHIKRSYRELNTLA